MGLVPEGWGLFWLIELGVVTLWDMIYLKTPTKDLSLGQIRKIVFETIKWCEANVGTNKCRPSFSILSDRGGSYIKYGKYMLRDKKILIYRTGCTDVRRVIRTTLHEYQHHLQDLELYNVILKFVGYNKHPQEVEARQTEKLYSSCWKEIKHKI